MEMTMGMTMVRIVNQLDGARGGLYGLSFITTNGTDCPNQYSCGALCGSISGMKLYHSFFVRVFGAPSIVTKINSLPSSLIRIHSQMRISIASPRQADESAGCRRIWGSDSLWNGRLPMRRDASVRQLTLGYLSGKNSDHLFSKNEERKLLEALGDMLKVRAFAYKSGSRW
ncbi:hypothetical protein B0H10DRAFT_1970893 [Mycena sp. CBHHK59/15]|nr:hypothetical protein B0H10DRAFT_1970893 [Mycena sp. CBHHK59/15]